MQCGTCSKHFSTHQMRIRPLRHFTEDIKISILPTVPIGLMQKKSPATSTKARNCGKQQVRRLYLTKITCKLGFLETVKLLSELFSSKTSDFKLGELSADNFKCLIFAQGLVSAKDAEIRRRVLSKLENEPDLTLQKLAEDCQRIASVRKDSKNIEESGVDCVRKVKHRSQSYSPVKERKNMITQNFNACRLVTTKKAPPSACYRCGKLHWAKDCPNSQKKVKTAINSDIRAHSLETEK